MRCTCRSIIFVAFLCGLGQSHATAISWTAKEVDLQSTLKRTREALGLDHLKALEHGVFGHGESQILGISGTFELAFDGLGRFFRNVDSQLPQCTLFDGKNSWNKDWNGNWRQLDLGDLDQNLLAGWLTTGQWILLPEALKLSDQSDSTNDLVVEGSLGHFNLEVHISPSTHLPVSATFLAAGKRGTIRWSKYQEFGTLKFPTSIELNLGGGLTTMNLSHLEPLQESGRFGKPETRYEDDFFDPEVNGSLEIMRAPTQHLLVPASVDEQEVGWFIFDTGAGANVISHHVAESLSLDRFGDVRALGVGGGEDSSYYRAQSLRVGPWQKEWPLFVGLDLKSLSQVMGVEIAGILGYDLLARCIVHFDISRPKIEIFDRDSEAPDDVLWQELLLYNRQANVRAEFEDHSGVFTLDTGAAASAVAFHTPTVHRLNLLDNRPHKASRVGGVGGHLTARAGVLDSIRFGGRDFSEINAVFATELEGGFFDAYTAGNIGGRLIRDVVIVIDYPNRRIAFLKP